MRKEIAESATRKAILEGEKDRHISPSNQCNINYLLFLWEKFVHFWNLITKIRSSTILAYSLLKKNFCLTNYLLEIIA